MLGPSWARQSDLVSLSRQITRLFCSLMPSYKPLLLLLRLKLPRHMFGQQKMKKYVATKDEEIRGFGSLIESSTVLHLLSHLLSLSPPVDTLCCFL